jgi:Site-specific recombinase XerD
MRHLQQAAEEYLALRRALGHDLAEAARLLPRFVAYLERIGAETITIEAALTWAQEPEASPATTMWARRMTVARGFARHMAGIDPATEVPPVGLFRSRQRWRPPYIYTADDIALLIDEVHQSITEPLRSATYETLIGLLAATGVRIGEAIRLDRGDVDWSDGLLLVRVSKFQKSRLVPLHETTLGALDRYARRRDGLCPRPKDPSFFVSLRAKRLLYATVCQTFRRLCDASGVGAEGALRPRLHDLRHTFAVATLAKWYREGVDVGARLPWLSTYMGHQEPRYTYWYLSATPELLALAAARLERAPWVVTP